MRRRLLSLLTALTLGVTGVAATPAVAAPAGTTHEMAQNVDAGNKLPARAQESRDGSSTSGVLIGSLAIIAVALMLAYNPAPGGVWKAPLTG